MALPDGAASIWVAAARFSQLDPNGYPGTGLLTVTTDQVVSASFNPVTSAGDDVELKNGNGDLIAWGRHGDMIKYGAVTLTLGTPDPLLEYLLTGGQLLADATTALGAPGVPTVVGQTTLGQLNAGTYGYRVTQYNAYGESVGTADVPVTIGATTAGLVVVSGSTLAASAVGARVYGRTIGGEQLLGSYFNIGSQATSAASGTGSPTSLAVTSLGQGIPLGTTFTITGDTNTRKIVFTTTAFAPKGSVSLPVSVSESITTTIAAGAIVPGFVDNGSLTPNGAIPSVDTTAGPGPYTGYQPAALGKVGNPNGVSVEIWGQAMVNGSRAANLPYYRWLFPAVRNLRITARDLTNANTATALDGQCFENPNWGSGPQGDWQFDSTKWFQRARCGSQLIPAISRLPVAANL